MARLLAALTAFTAAATALGLRQSIWSGQALPLTIGHRGLLSQYPENTLISFQAALEAGADGIEGDLHLTSDNVVVMLHDDTLNRTTNCTGWVANYTYAQLASCNAAYASKWGPKFGFVPIPRFEEVVQLISQPQYDALFIMDMKWDSGRGLYGKWIQPILAQYGAESRATASCWEFAQLEDSVQYLPNGPRQWLGSTTPGNALTNASLWAEWMAPPYSMRGFSLNYIINSPTTSISAEFVSQAHARLMSVVSWIVNDVPSWKQLAIWGVDGIITDVVDQLVAWEKPLLPLLANVINTSSINATGDATLLA